ncbi:MAG: oligosaccharide flippase family protein [Myxococcales bacterium]|nr:oligosaccharide flippase family protein [Myxococcales bacterium]
MDLTGPNGVVRRVLRSPTFVYTGLAALSRASSILLAPFLTRHLTNAEYGDLAFYQSAAGILGMLLSLGLLAAITRFFFEGSDRASALAKAGGVARWLFLFVGGGASVLLAALLLSPMSESNKHHWLSTVLAAVGTASIAVPLALARARQLPFVVLWLAIAELGGLVAATLALVGPLGRGLDGALEAMAVSGAISAVTALAVVFLSVPGKLVWAHLREALRFSVPFIPHFIANQLLTIGDRWILKANGLEARLGPYALASQLSAPIGMIVGAHNETASAVLGEQSRERGREWLHAQLPRLAKGYYRIALPLCIIASASSPLLPLLFSDRFAEASLLLPFLSLSLLVEVLYYPAANILFFANATRYIPVLSVTAGVVSLVLNLVLIPRWGAWGALASRLLAMSLRSALAAWLALRVTRPHAGNLDGA